MGKVGCYLIPPFKDVLFRWTWSKEHKVFSMIWYDAWESYFDLISLSNPSPSLWRRSLPWAHLLLTINAHQATATQSQKALDLHRGKHSSWSCIVFYFYCFKIIFKSAICPWTIYFIWSNLNYKAQIEMTLKIIAIMENTDCVKLNPRLKLSHIPFIYFFHTYVRTRKSHHVYHIHCCDLLWS